MIAIDTLEIKKIDNILRKIIPFAILLFFKGQILSQTSNLTNAEITTNNILINGIKLFDSLGVLRIDQMTSELPQVSFFYSKYKVRWQNIEFKKTGFEISKISDTLSKSDNKNFILLTIFPNKMNSIKINNEVLNITTLTCQELNTFINKVFVDNYPKSKKENSPVTAGNGKYLLSFHFKKCKKLDHIIINCPLHR